MPGNFPRKAERKFREASDPKSFERGILQDLFDPVARGAIDLLKKAMRRASSQASGLLVTHQPQELGFVNVAVFDEAGN